MQPVDKKIAFVLGLALLFKVPFDLALQIFGASIVMTDVASLHQQWGALALVLQGLLCVAFLQYYGLWRAVAVSLFGPDGGRKKST